MAKEELLINEESINNIYEKLDSSYMYEDAEKINDYINDIFDIISIYKDSKDEIIDFAIKLLDDEITTIDGLQEIKSADFIQSFQNNEPEQLKYYVDDFRSVGDFYKIAETYQIGDSEIGYGASDSEIGKTYGTWECIPSVTEEKGEKDWFYGHYFDTENDAKEDFKNRIADKEDLLYIKEENRYVNKENIKENTKEIENGFSLEGMKALKKGLETKELKPPTNNREER